MRRRWGDVPFQPPRSAIQEPPCLDHSGYGPRHNVYDEHHPIVCLLKIGGLDQGGINGVFNMMKRRLAEEALDNASQDVRPGLDDCMDALVALHRLLGRLISSDIAPEPPTYCPIHPPTVRPRATRAEVH